MSFFKQEVSVSDSSYPAVSAPSVDLSAKFEPTEFVLINEGGGADDPPVAVSFDGVEDHLILDFALVNESIKVRTRARKIWLRLESGTGPSVVVVMANTDV